MFFVENGLDQADVDTAKENHLGQMTNQVYYCLRVLRDNMKREGKTLSAAILRDKLKKCDHHLYFPPS